ncbi:MAG: prepilin-type N-terminal cleavage/methylation domain-containing protein [Candidatus Omnitrophica bacterium]|nr:prepilin-type N-terminal cleavage/methylation domain-containing protein [Candidatus Omnitrophota bacterium]
MKRNQKHGFTLLELLVVVIVVGILASVALPQFQKMMLRSRASEGVNTLGAILTAELLYYQERSTFTATAADLLVTIPANGTTWFNYTFPAATGTSAQVVATGSAVAVNGATVPATVIVTGTINDTGTRTITTTGL